MQCPAITALMMPAMNGKPKAMAFYRVYASRVPSSLKVP
jgi:hypothetical protein